jgi:hypothetical protein
VDWQKQVKGVIAGIVFVILVALATWGRTVGVWRRSRTAVLPHTQGKIDALKEDDS